jgi:hypothetical protein
MSWRLVCHDCAKLVGEIKTIGVLAVMPYDCAGCRAPLGAMSNGHADGNPVTPWQLEDLRAKLAAR